MNNRVIRRKGGFTLVELTVVLLILVALAGILIPQVSGYVERSHASSVSSNIGEINKFVQLHQVKFLGDGYGSRFDSLLNAAEGAVAFEGLEVNAAKLNIAALAVYQREALFNAGIKEVAAMTDGAIDKTFSPYEAVGSPDEFVSLDSTAAAPLGNAVFLQPAHAQTLGLTNANEQYVVFGLGSKTTLINRVMTEAPLHFDAVDPKTTYSRFLLVFAVPNSQAAFDAGFEKARFVSALGSEADGLGAHLSTYYSKDAR